MNKDKFISWLMERDKSLLKELNIQRGQNFNEAQSCKDKRNEIERILIAVDKGIFN